MTMWRNDTATNHGKPTTADTAARQIRYDEKARKKKKGKKKNDEKKKARKSRTVTTKSGEKPDGGKERRLLMHGKYDATGDGKRMATAAAAMVPATASAIQCALRNGGDGGDAR